MTISTRTRVTVPFRAAFGRARIEALAGTGVGRDAEAAAEDAAFEYALLRRGKKRTREEELWNALGLRDGSSSR